MKVKNYLIGGALTAFLLTLTTASAFADQSSETQTSGQRGQEKGVEKGFEIDRELRDRIEAALDDEDYNEWVDLIDDTKMGDKLLEVITEDNFDEFVDAHDLMREAHDNMEAAQEILDELGVERPMGKRHMGPRKGGPSFGKNGEKRPEFGENGERPQPPQDDSTQ